MDYARPWLLDEIARTFPNLRIIIGRMGLPFHHQRSACSVNTKTSLPI
jgi:predicted TIM-barrel fold metal-dependent hydrolase